MIMMQERTLCRRLSDATCKMYGNPMKIWAGAERTVLAFPDRLDNSCIFAAGQSITASPLRLSTLPADSTDKIEAPQSIE